MSTQFEPRSYDDAARSPASACVEDGVASKNHAPFPVSVREHGLHEPVVRTMDLNVDFTNLEKRTEAFLEFLDFEDSCFVIGFEYEIDNPRFAATSPGRTCGHDRHDQDT